MNSGSHDRNARNAKKFDSNSRFLALRSLCLRGFIWLPRNARGFWGFTLVEVMVATMVMALMLVSMLGYVSMASENWRRIDRVVTLTGESSQFFDRLRYFSENSLSMQPQLGQMANTATFVLFVATGTPGSAFFVGSLTMRVGFAPAPPTVIATYTSFSPSGAGKIDFKTTEADANDVAIGRFIGTLSEHVASFSAERVSPNSMRVWALMEIPDMDVAYSSTFATPSYEATATFFAPGAN